MRLFLNATPKLNSILEHYVPNVSTFCVQNDIFHKSLVEYNKLPAILENSENLHMFRR